MLEKPIDQLIAELVITTSGTTAVFDPERLLNAKVLKTSVNAMAYTIQQNTEYDGALVGAVCSIGERVFSWKVSQALGKPCVTLNPQPTGHLVVTSTGKDFLRNKRAVLVEAICPSPAQIDHAAAAVRRAGGVLTQVYALWDNTNKGRWTSVPVVALVTPDGLRHPR